MRTLFYLLARLFGDVKAVSRGKYPQRVVRKKVLGKFNSKLNKWLRF